jgi:hypothetical protein
VLPAILCPFGLYFSNWLELVYSDGKVTSFSSFRRCINETQRISVTCEDYLTFDDMFSPSWRAVTILFGAGSCLQILVALTALFGLCIKGLFNVCVLIIMVITQVIGALLYISGILVFPVGWGVPQVQEVCGDSDLYHPGRCTLGWAFIIIIIGTFIAIIATTISWTPVLKRKADRNSSSYTI